MKKHKMIRHALTMTVTLFGVAALRLDPAFASCADINNAVPGSVHAALSAALNGALAPAVGLNNEMWGTIVDRDGIVCAVAFTGASRGDQWPGSRVISAQKANTANAFSRPAGVMGFAAPLSTANLWAATQPGGSLYGLQESNPVNPAVAYAGNAANYGQVNDPMVGQKIGGVNVFGGGLALYSGTVAASTLLGAIGVSGDTSCADHIIAWRARDILDLDAIPGGVAGGTDNIIFDVTGSHGNFQSKSGFGHPECGFDERPSAEGLPASNQIE